MVVWWCCGGIPISTSTSALAVRHMRPPVTGHSSRSRRPTPEVHTGKATNTHHIRMMHVGMIHMDIESLLTACVPHIDLLTVLVTS